MASHLVAFSLSQPHSAARQPVPPTSIHPSPPLPSPQVPHNQPIPPCRWNKQMWRTRENIYRLDRRKKASEAAKGNRDGHSGRGFWPSPPLIQLLRINIYTFFFFFNLFSSLKRNRCIWWTCCSFKKKRQRWDRDRQCPSCFLGIIHPGWTR